MGGVGGEQEKGMMLQSEVLLCVFDQKQRLSAEYNPEQQWG